MGTIHIRVLGAIDVAGENGASIALNPKAKLLLAYLVLHRLTPQTRQHVAFVFYSESTESLARANLRGLIRELRQTLPDAEGCMDTEGQNMQWRADGPCVHVRILSQLRAARRRTSSPGYNGRPGAARVSAPASVRS